MPDLPKPNLDLIQMVQRARMIHDASAKPSVISGVYWIEAKPLNDDVQPTAHAGDWQIPTTVNEVDSLWETIKQATEAGQLGYKARVSTVAAPGQPHREARMILVCTRDAEDETDKNRVRENLLKLGITTDLHYQQR